MFGSQSLTHIGHVYHVTCSLTHDKKTSRRQSLEKMATEIIIMEATSDVEPSIVISQGSNEGDALGEPAAAEPLLGDHLADMGGRHGEGDTTTPGFPRKLGVRSEVPAFRARRGVHWDFPEIWACVQKCQPSEPSTVARLELFLVALGLLPKYPMRKMCGLIRFFFFRCALVFLQNLGVRSEVSAFRAKRVSESGTFRNWPRLPALKPDSGNVRLDQFFFLQVRTGISPKFGRAFISASLQSQER
ncbi:hypothetical protein PoB_000248000 [Plakobranchus ocellatus]|uniref:Uncharacterized protein n=1 Tax=Plakobranchus ocellatus TaxID=259542 RepID=A0AAV3XZ94_9GAST|nr:hypothetical protein PoB_000248000 [Plakobranchus ocellatus]